MYGQAPHCGKHDNGQIWLPEIVDVMVAEITNEDDFQKDCSKAWRKVFCKEPELQAANLQCVPEFEMRTRVQYAGVFREPTGLAPARMDGEFGIRTIPGREPPQHSPYRLTPDEWEVYKEKTQALLTKRLIRKSNSPSAAPVIFIPLGLDDKGRPKIRMLIYYRALKKITVRDRFLPHPEDLIARLHRRKRFTKLDFWSISAAVIWIQQRRPPLSALTPFTNGW